MLALTKLTTGPGNVALCERPDPVVTPLHVIVAVRAAGVCGSDLHILDGLARTSTPVTIGHEASGEVVEVGEGVDRSWLGARVVTETHVHTCGRCSFCLSGRINMCTERRSIGTDVDGAFAPYLLVPARNLHVIPAWLDTVAAALAEPLACVCHSLLESAALHEGLEVLVAGPGPIGLLAAQTARSRGCRVHVRGTPRDAARLAAAARMGFETSTTDDTAPQADVVVECSGSASSIATCLAAARRGGRYVQIGIARKPVSVPLDLVCFRELTVTSGSASTPSSWRLALELIASRAVQLDPLVSAVMPIARWVEAFAAARASQVIKVLLDPQ
jgi:L-iditol 2-dehydrogenase